MLRKGMTQAQFRTGARVRFAAFCCAFVVAAGCGSSVKDDDVGASARPPASAAEPDAQTPEAATAAPVAEGPTDQAPPVADGPNDQPTGAAANLPGAPSTPANSNTPGPATAASESTRATKPASTAPTTQKAPASTRTGGSAQPPQDPAAPVGPTPPEAGAGEVKGELVLGSLGTDSGVLGAVFAPAVHGVRAWVSDVNARGGVNGHPVRVIYADDGGDPNKALVLARRLVDEDHVAGIIGEHAVTTLNAALPFLEKRRIPIFGGTNASAGAEKSPMVFYIGTGNPTGNAWAHVLPLLAGSDKRKVALFYCAEAGGCKTARDIVHKVADEAGITIVNDVQVSLAQPDYTAEVLAARNAGAEAILGLIDGPSLIRVARAAHRQGYSPVLTSQWATNTEQFGRDGGSDVEGVLLGASNLNWTSPKMTDYRNAMNRYVPGGLLASIGVNAWQGGKLIERIGEGLSANPTNEDILRGLYALDGETLGGTVLPLTFPEGKPTSDTYHCVVLVEVSGGKSTTPNGDNWTCPPGWEPLRK